MRFISDIIKEKRNAAPEAAAPEAQSLTQPAPLLLEDPLEMDAPDTRVKSAYEDWQDDWDTAEIDTAGAAAENTEPHGHAPGIDLSPETDDTPEADAAPEPQRAQTATPAPEVSLADFAETAALPEGLTPIAEALEGEALPSPTAGRAEARSARVKTRLLGFSAAALAEDDPFDAAPARDDSFPVGWLVVVSDLGRGSSFALKDGVTTLGRGQDQTVCLDFGDNSISRSNHVSIAFDAEQNKFFIGHSGKANLVRINMMPLLSTEELSSGDMIRLGESTLRFFAFCDDSFDWNAQTPPVARRA